MYKEFKNWIKRKSLIYEVQFSWSRSMQYNKRKLRKKTMKTKKLVLNTAKVDACYILYYVVHWAVQSQLSTMCSCWTIDVWSSKFCCGAPYRTSALGACCQVMLILRIVFFLINNMLTPSLAFKFSPSSSSSFFQYVCIYM